MLVHQQTLCRLSSGEIGNHILTNHNTKYMNRKQQTQQARNMLAVTIEVSRLTGLATSNVIRHCPICDSPSSPFMSLDNLKEIHSKSHTKREKCYWMSASERWLSISLCRIYSYFTSETRLAWETVPGHPRSSGCLTPFFIYSGTFIYILSGHIYLWRFLENAETIILDFTQMDFV